MYFKFRANLQGLAAAALLGALISGCSGGTSSPTALPQTQSIPGDRVPQSIDSSSQSAEVLLGTLKVDRGSANSVAAKVSNAAAYYMPLKGGALPRMGNLSGRMGSSPMDLTNFGGPTLSAVKQYNLYVNSTNGAPWGYPVNPQKNWTNSSFAHLLDQYTGSTTTGRYTWNGPFDITYNTTGTLQDQDIYNIIHAAAAIKGTGYGNIYHVFLQSGVQQCSSAAGGCYAVQYCAYHGAVDFNDIGHTIYSMEGYQGISGCNSPSNKLRDSTWAVLSHELYESITDPDVQTNAAWYNNAFGEIGDICRSNYGNVVLNGVSYDIQQEYSNKYHQCTFAQ